MTNFCPVKLARDTFSPLKLGSSMGGAGFPIQGWLEVGGSWADSPVALAQSGRRIATIHEIKPNVLFRLPQRNQRIIKSSFLSGDRYFSEGPFPCPSRKNALGGSSICPALGAVSKLREEIESIYAQVPRASSTSIAVPITQPSSEAFTWFLCAQAVGRFEGRRAQSASPRRSGRSSVRYRGSPATPPRSSAAPGRGRLRPCR